MRKILMLVFLILIICTSCKEPPVVQDGALITSFTFKAADNTALSTDITAEITDLIITAEVPYGTDVTALKPVIEISEGAATFPETIAAENFSIPVIYKVTSGDLTKSNAYVVVVTISEFRESGNIFSSTALQQLEMTTGADASDYFGSGIGNSASVLNCPGGTAFSENGSVLAIGAPGFLADGANPIGAVFVFEKSGGLWNLKAELTGSIAEYMDDFGSSVAVSSDGSVIAVGAPVDEPAGGSANGLVYIFERSGSSWSDTTETAVLYPSDTVPSTMTGFSLAINGDGSVVAVGTPFASVTASNQEGKVHVFEKPSGGWPAFVAGTTNESALLTISSSNLENYAYLGRSIDISKDGSTVAAGAPGYAIDGSSRGAAFVFIEPALGWDEDGINATITPVDEAALLKAELSAAQADALGYSISISEDGSGIAVGAPYYTHSGSSNGVVLYYDNPGTWSAAAEVTETQLIIAPDGLISDAFGRSVALSGTAKQLIVGAPLDDALEAEEGSVYLFDDTDGSYIFNMKFTEADTLQAYSHMGRTCSISPDASVISVSAPSYDGAFSDTGTVFIYQ